MKKVFWIIIIFLMFGCKPERNLNLIKPTRISASFNEDITPKSFAKKDDADFGWRNIENVNQREMNWLKIEFNNITIEEPYLITPPSRFAYRVIYKNEIYHPFAGDFNELHARSYRSNPYIFKLDKNEHTFYVFFPEGFMHHTFMTDGVAIGTKSEIKEFALIINKDKLLHDQIFFYHAVNLFLIGIFSIVLFFFIHKKQKSLLFFGLMVFTAGLFHLRISPFLVFIEDTKLSKSFTFFFMISLIYLFYTIFINTFFKIKKPAINIILYIILFIASITFLIFGHFFHPIKYIYLAYFILTFVQIAQATLRNKSFDLTTKVVFILGFGFNSMIISANWFFEIFRFHKYLSPISMGMNAISVAMIIYMIKMYKNQQLELKESKIKLINLQKENLAAELVSLKQQIDPHFLFNSLGALISLIEESKESAQEFVEELSKVYRYILKIKDKNLIELRRELDFVESYIFLLSHRFRGNLKVEMEFKKGYCHRLLVPASIQMLLENCVKHNIISAEKPLLVNISSKDEYIVVKNNLQPKFSKEDSEQIGLENLRKRFSYYTNKAVIIEKNETSFIVKIPLIEEID